MAGTTLLIAAGFTLVQLHYIYLGTTTNESAKWDEVAACIDEGSLYFYDHPSEELRKQSHDSNVPSIVLQRRRDGGFNRVLTDDELARIEREQLTMRQVTNFSQINNIYDHGFWNNFKVLMFPTPLY
jgi:palmitoyltransferase